MTDTTASAQIREITSRLTALESEKFGLVYPHLDTNIPADEYHQRYRAAEKMAAGRRKEINVEIRQLREQRKTLQAKVSSERRRGVRERQAVRLAERENKTQECQICENRQCLDSSGCMVHHGYQRPGDGANHGDCFGVGRKPYPATDALTDYLAAIIRERDAVAEALRSLPERTELTRKPRFRGDQWVTIVKGECEGREWENEMGNQRRRLEMNRNSLDGEVARCTRRISQAQASQVGNS